MRVLTFGVQVAEVAVDVETGEVRVERIAAIHDVGRVINPLGASSQVEGGIIQGLGHTLSEQRLLDPETGVVLTQTLDAYKLPTIADVPEIVAELVDIPDEHLTNLGSKGLGEPPIIPTAAAIANAIRDATGADVRSLPITREEMLRALKEARERAELTLTRPASLDALDGTPLAGGTELVPLLRDGTSARTRSSDVRDAAAARRRGRRDRGRDDARRAGGRPRVPEALREACRLAASPQLRAMGTIAGNLLQATRCWYWRLELPVLPPRRRPLPRPRGPAPRARDLRQRAAARPRTRPTPPRRCSRCGATRRHDAASSRSPSSTGCRPRTTASSTRSSRAS